MTFDLGTFAGVAAAVTALIGLAKKFWPVIVEGREPLIALAGGLILSVISKVAGLGFADVSWIELVITGIGAGIGSQLIHDKLVNPAMGKEEPAK